MTDFLWLESNVKALIVVIRKTIILLTVHQMAHFVIVPKVAGRLGRVHLLKRSASIALNTSA